MESLSLKEEPSLSPNTVAEDISKDNFPPTPTKPSGTASSTLYPKILKFGDFLHATKDLGPLTSIHLTGSVKLHGTHADIVFSSDSDEVRLQSRNQLRLTPGKEDNCGFASFVAGTKKEVLLDLRDRILERYRKLNPNEVVEGDIIMAGEWCGKGVQKKVAISKMEKFFAIISTNINGNWVPDWEYADISNEVASFYHVGKADFFEHELFFDNVNASEEQIRKLTDEVEAECPFAKKLGQSGLGEGIVWKATKYCGEPKFWFKSKGDLLAVSNVAKMPASAVDKENRERVDNFAHAIVTENRLEQGWDLLEHKNAGGLGAFLKWVQNDCLVEEKREMEGLNISKGKLSPAIAAIAKPWFWKRIGR
ncbi:hypothetical protein P7C71_g3940, partial [Lecanoromycetidae sp. Uapishka_2]